jgi:hypothetical protein
MRLSLLDLKSRHRAPLDSIDTGNVAGLASRMPWARQEVSPDEPRNGIAPPYRGRARGARGSEGGDHAMPSG